jgi:hypothetical protein
MEQEVLPQLHWSIKLDDLLTEADATPQGALSIYAVDEQIPQTARVGYAALVMAYTRENEPVALLEDGSAALLTIEGGITGASAVAARVLAQLDKLGLRQTVRAGVAAMTDSSHQALDRAKTAAAGAEAGEASVAI